MVFPSVFEHETDFSVPTLTFSSRRTELVLYRAEAARVAHPRAKALPRAPLEILMSNYFRTQPRVSARTPESPMIAPPNYHRRVNYNPRARAD